MFRLALFLGLFLLCCSVRCQPGACERQHLDYVNIMSGKSPYGGKFTPQQVFEDITHWQTIAHILGCGQDDLVNDKSPMAMEVKRRLLDSVPTVRQYTAPEKKSGRADDIPGTFTLPVNYVTGDEPDVYKETWFKVFGKHGIKDEAEPAATDEQFLQEKIKKAGKQSETDSSEESKAILARLEKETEIAQTGVVEGFAAMRVQVSEAADNIAKGLNDWAEKFTQGMSDRQKTPHSSPGNQSILSRLISFLLKALFPGLLLVTFWFTLSPAYFFSCVALPFALFYGMTFCCDTFGVLCPLNRQ